MKRLIAIFLVLLFCFAGLFALESVYDIFPSLDVETIAEMVENGKSIESSTLTDSIAKLSPSSSMAYEKAKAAEEENNSFSVGVVSFVAYPQEWETLTEREKQLKIFNILTSVSTQKGITYISRTAGYKERVLIEDSYTIADNGKKSSQIPDPFFFELPETYSLKSYQKDNRFGGNTFKLDYVTSEEEVFLSITNLSTMKFMGFTCLQKNKLAMYIDTYLTQEGIVIYSMATIYDKEPEIKLVVYTVDLQSSFMRRITGFKDWFINMVN